MRILATLLGFALLAGASDRQPGSPIEASTCRVRSITDGDTFRCTGGVRVRLLLIDTPERNQVPHGAAAARALESLLSPGDEVSLESDVQATDRYGRALAYVYLADGRMVNEEMARMGYAVALVYPPNVRHVERIRKAVETAREKACNLFPGILRAAVPDRSSSNASAIRSVASATSCAFAFLCGTSSTSSKGVISMHVPSDMYGKAPLSIHVPPENARNGRQVMLRGAVAAT